MSVVGPRNRTVFFRISEAEFEKLVTMCRSQAGSRNISELARAAVQDLLAQKEASSYELSARLEQFDRCIGELNRKVEKVLCLLGTQPSETGQGLGGTAGGGNDGRASEEAGDGNNSYR